MTLLDFAKEFCGTTKLLVTIYPTVSSDPSGNLSLVVPTKVRDIGLNPHLVNPHDPKGAFCLKLECVTIISILPTDFLTDCGDGCIRLLCETPIENFRVIEHYLNGFSAQQNGDNKRPHTPRRVAVPHFDTTPPDCMATEDYSPTDGGGNPYAYSLGFRTGSFVFCPDCGQMVRSAYDTFESQEAADQYAREHCPVCSAAAKKTAARTRRFQFIQELGAIVKQADTTVQRLEHCTEGYIGDGVSVLIRYNSTFREVPIEHSSLLCIAKSVFEALEY